MKEIIIKINRNEVFDEVSLKTAYTAAKSEDGNGNFDRVATIDADESLLSRFWRDICGFATDHLSYFVKTFSISSDLFSLTFELSNAFNETETSAITNDIIAALATGITEKWMLVASPSHAPEFATQTLSILDRILSRFCQRRRPTRKNL